MSQTCFFCQKAPAQPAASVLVRLKKTLGQDGNKLYLKTMKIEVPACAPCGKSQADVEWKKNLLVLGCFLTPAIVGLLALGPHGALFGAGIGFFLAIAVSSFSQGWLRSHHHPEVEALLKDGWYVD